ncbi:MAG: DUF1569 domain-containing protein [bacterium]
MIVERMRRVRPETAPRWGVMTAPQMVVHLTDALRMATGDLVVRGKQHPVRFPPLKQLLIYVLPMPKGSPTARELQARVPQAFAGEQEAFGAAMERFARRDPAEPWPPHPLFGAMSRRDWGVLAYRHCHHHLTQFGA